jgi:two-component system LytT family response regulator
MKLPADLPPPLSAEHPRFLGERFQRVEGEEAAAAATPAPARTPAARLRFTRVENERFEASRSAPVAYLSRSRPGPILVLRVSGRAIIVDEASIDWINAAGNYVKLYAGQHRHRVRGTLKELQGVLPRQFVRSHRCTIINVAAVHEFVHTPFGDLIAVLRSGDRLTVGRTYRRHVEAAFSVRL